MMSFSNMFFNSGIKFNAYSKHFSTSVDDSSTITEYTTESLSKIKFVELKLIAKSLGMPPKRAKKAKLIELILYVR